MMTVKQLDLLMRNETGSLSEVIDLLNANGVTVIAFYLTGIKDKGRVRLITNDPDKALNILLTGGYKVEINDVIACEMPSHPGGINAILRPLKEADLNIDLLYTCMGTGIRTVLIMAVNDLERALKILGENWIRILGDELYDFFPLATEQ